MKNRLLGWSVILVASCGSGLDASEAVGHAGFASPSPRITGARSFGVRPGAPVLFSITATGAGPMTYSAKGLPPGIRLEPTTGQLTGACLSPGTYPVVVTAMNGAGKAERILRLSVGEAICLTPPLGWNSWNCWGGEVSQDKVLATARAMVDSGLRAHGWTYINIDDGWQGMRGGPFNAIQPNRKFPDMKGLADEIHALGLKLGIYSTPWRGSYYGHVGSSCDRTDGIYGWIESKDHNPDMRIASDP